VHRILELYEPFAAQVRILNLHDENDGQQPSMVTSLLCNVLESAPTACAASQRIMEQQQDQEAEPFRNDQLLDVASDQKWYDFELIDELVTEAARHGHIRQLRCTRTAATLTTQYYVQQHLHLQARDLPQQCPDRSAAQKLLDESLVYEWSILGHAEKEHEKAFWKWTQTKQICSIHMGVVLRKAEWRAFFRHLTNTSAEPIRSGQRKPGTPKRRYLRGEVVVGSE